MSKHNPDNNFLFSLYISSKTVALHQISFDDNMDSDTETGSEMSNDESSSSESSSDEEDDTPQAASSSRGRGARTRGGATRARRVVRTRGGIQPSSTTNQPATEWVDWASSPFTPEIPDFEGNPGPIIPPKNIPREYVEEFLDEDFLQLIVIETNRYARQFLSKNDTSTSSQDNKWTPVSAIDVRNYFCLSILMGINSLPTIQDYWSQNILYKNPVYNAVMSRNR